MSCPRYSRNKYRCLLNPNVIVSKDNNIYQPAPKPTPNPHLYYDSLGRYPGYGYPGYGYGYPGYGYPGYGYGYPGYGYPGYGYPGMMPYVANDKIKPKPKPKKEKNVEPTMNPHYGYWSSSSSSSEDDTCRYYRRHAKVREQDQGPDINPEKVEKGERLYRRVFEENEITTPYPPEPDPVPIDHIDKNDKEIVKNKKQFAKPFAKLLTKLTTVEPKEFEPKESLGNSNITEIKNEIENMIPIASEQNEKVEKKIYLKV